MPHNTLHYDVIVIGGGAAGMMAAGRAAERGKRVLLLEKNTELGKKLKITGGGRCNITNAEENEHVLLGCYGKAKSFLHSSFAQFGVAETFSFFTTRGLPLKVEAKKRAFPETEKAEDVFNVLLQYLKKGGVDVRTKMTVKRLVANEHTIVAIEAARETFTADSYILATGGKSHPETGSTGDGFRFLQDLGHEVSEPTPTIVPLSIPTKWIHALSGVTLPNVKITFFINGQKYLAKKGDILCTHFGLSGPTILNSAGLVSDALHEGEVTATIDLFPTLDYGALDTHLTKLFDENKNKTLKNAAKLFTPVGTAHALLPLFDINEEKKIHSVTKDERKRLVQILKALPLSISGLMGYDKAVVADGGIALTEIDSKTMRSKRYNNLFITGDLLDIRRPSGGYSLQLCWTTGFVAGEHAF